MGNERYWHFRRGLGATFMLSMDGIEKHYFSHGILRTTSWSCRKHSLPASEKLGYSHRTTASFCARETYPRCSNLFYLHHGPATSLLTQSADTSWVANWNQNADSILQVVSQNTRSLAAICPPRQTQRPSCTE
jgi:hypothetical protein